MRKTFIFVLVLNTLLLASSDNKREAIVKKEIEKQLEREKRYAKDGIFYKGKDYNLKSYEVNEESLKSLPDIEEDNTGDDILEMD